MNSNQDRISSGTTSEMQLKPDKVNINFIRPPSAFQRTHHRQTRYDKLSHMISDDSRHAAIKNNYSGDAGSSRRQST
jgi:hypothetical protein